MIPDPEVVARLLRRVVAEVVLPRFRKLERHEIREKGPGDLVTTADTEAERLLAPLLQDLAPGSVVVGEEAYATNRGILERLSGDAAVWLIDPVDGTSNFAHGNPDFATIVAYVERGIVRAGWIHEPLENETVWAVAGQGTWREGKRVDSPKPPPFGSMIGLASGRLPDGKRARDVLRNEGALGRFVNIRCAGRSYTRLAAGDLHYAYFSRSKPWDHAAGWLIHREAGGVGAFLDGSAYTPGRSDHPLLLAPDHARWKRLQEILLQKS